MTYSIVAADGNQRLYGVAVASKAMCVGAHVPWGASGIGVLATQAWHDLLYGSNGLELLRQGHSAASVLHQLTNGDPDAPSKQLGLIDAKGRIASYTGSRCLPWAGGMCGADFAVQGNLLAGPQVVEAMAQAWEDCADRLPFMPRLVTALLAGDEAGGDRRGRQSAALRVWRWDPSHEPTAIDSVADLRIDDAEYPVHDLMQMLPRLWLEYGRADKERSLMLEGEIRARVADRLRAPPAEAEPALESWARDRNLESRLLEGRIDPTVLDVLERGVDEVLAQVGEQVPRQFWPD